MTFTGCIAIGILSLFGMTATLIGGNVGWAFIFGLLFLGSGIGLALLILGSKND